VPRNAVLRGWGMDEANRERLRLVIAVALRIAPTVVKKAFADRKSGYDSDDAARHLSQAATDAVLQAYDVVEKPPSPPGRGVPSRPDA
jgi:hypothetical protein